MHVTSIIWAPKKIFYDFIFIWVLPIYLGNNIKPALPKIVQQ